VSEQSSLTVHCTGAFENTTLIDFLVEMEKKIKLSFKTVQTHKNGLEIIN
jgi:hypothetical protein